MSEKVSDAQFQLFTRSINKLKLFDMKNLILSSAFIALTVSLWATDITFPITKATVYEEGATITRVGDVKLEKGEQTVRITDLPVNLDNQSLDIWISGNAIILSQKFEFTYKGEVKNVTGIEKKKKSLKDSLVYVNMLMSIKQEESNIIRDNSNPKDFDRPFDYDEVIEIRKRYRKEMLMIETDILKLREKIDKLNLEIATLDAQLKRTGSNTRKRVGDLVLKISSPRAYTAKAEMSYLHLDAGWTPSYDLRVNSLENPLQIDYKAEIYQNTGEDWDDISLSISTAQPTRDYNLPLLSAYYLSFNNYYSSDGDWKNAFTGPYLTGVIMDNSGEPLIGANVLIKGTAVGTITDIDGRFTLRSTTPNPRLVLSYTGYHTQEISAYDGDMMIRLEEGHLLEEVVVSGYSSLDGAVAGLAPRKKRKKEVVPISLVKSTTSYSYDIRGRISLSSTKEAETVFIRSEDAETSYVYQAFPKIEDLAYLTAEIDNWSELQIIPGNANIYLDNRYVGQTNIDDEYREDGDKIISLGQDRSVSVTRLLSKDYKKRKSLGKNIIEKRKWEIVVDNQRSEKIDIAIMDQYPVSKDSDIKIELKEDSGATKNKDLGLLTWYKDLNSGESLSMIFEYEVKAPRHRSLIVE